jgi:AcrR family transcriptional regulator
VDAIVEAAARILVRDGYAAASTNTIAETAGVSIGSLYQYFQDKDDVFRAVVERHRQQVMPVIAEVLERMRAPRADLVELTLELLRRMAQVNSSEPRLLAAIDRELGWLEHAGEGDDEGQAVAAVSAILRAQPARYPCPVEVTALLIVTIIAPLSRWMVHSKPSWLDTEQFLSAIGRMLRGLLETHGVASG